MLAAMICLFAERTSFRISATSSSTLCSREGEEAPFWAINNAPGANVAQISIVPRVFKQVRFMLAFLVGSDGPRPSEILLNSEGPPEREPPFAWEVTDKTGQRSVLAQ